jgi:hypothetical protein
MAGRSATSPADGTADAALTRTVAALDRQLCDAYNACDIPAFSALFAPGVALFRRTPVSANWRRTTAKAVRRS